MAVTNSARSTSILRVIDVDLVAVSKQLARKDKTLGAFIKKVGPCTLSGPIHESHFESIVFAVIAQQLSAKAADTITFRLLDLVGSPLEPKNVLKKTDEQLRSVGLSGAKARTIREFAQVVHSGELDLDALDEMTDDEVHQELTKLWGIGRWTAEMAMIFRLGRLDVWPVGDLAVRKGFTKIYGLSAVPNEVDFESLADHLKPYRSVVAWYCWRATDETTQIW